MGNDNGWQNEFHLTQPYMGINWIACIGNRPITTKWIYKVKKTPWTKARLMVKMFE